VVHVVGDLREDAGGAGAEEEDCRDRAEAVYEDCAGE